MPVNSTRRKELNHLLPEGSIATRSWLMDNGFDRHAIDNLIKSDQLTSVTPGVYTRWNAKPTWEGVVYFMQTHLGLNLTVGGLTALELSGYSHYLPFAAKRKIHLYGTAALPTWIEKVIPNVEFEWHSELDLLGKSGKELETPSHDPLQNFTKLQPWKEGIGNIRLSSPERAILEILLDVPKEISFEHADQLMQNMNTLSPRSLQPLLEACDNKKVRRLFFWLAERHQHAWLAKMRPQKINFGSGKRMLAKDGRLDKKYNITIPKYL
jgi:hypothetical protein